MGWEGGVLLGEGNLSSPHLQLFLNGEPVQSGYGVLNQAYGS